MTTLHLRTMNKYHVLDWIFYRSDLGFTKLDSFLNAYDFSDWLRQNLGRFEDNPNELSISEVERIIIELKQHLDIPVGMFKEIETIIALQKELAPPFYPFTKEGFAIHKNGGEWKLYHRASGQLVSTLTNRGNGELKSSTKLACITCSNFQGQGLTTELGKLYISEIIPEGGVFEISAFNPASATLANKGGFTLNKDTNTWVLKT